MKYTIGFHVCVCCRYAVIRKSSMVKHLRTQKHILYRDKLNPVLMDDNGVAEIDLPDIMNENGWDFDENIRTHKLYI